MIVSSILPEAMIIVIILLERKTLLFDSSLFPVLQNKRELFLCNLPASRLKNSGRSVRKARRDEKC